MLLILITWLLYLGFFLATGIVVKSLLKIKTSGIYLPLFFGLFLQCVILVIAAFFIKLGLTFFLINIGIQIVFWLWKYQEIKKCLLETIDDVFAISLISKVILVVIAIYSLLKCAQFPFIIDNESYYLQTIKWVNEYGIVKGLGNLHVFFAQTSPFHILQAGFNFNFITDRINDLNGFILLISSLFFITEFEKKYIEKNEIHWIGLLLVFNVLFVQFINAPSPDLPLLLLSQVIFYYYLEKESNFSNFLIILLLFLFIFFIKITIAPIGILLLFIIEKEKKRTMFFVLFTSLICSILLFKNFILTGYPLYPFQLLEADVDWKIPSSLVQFISNNTKSAGYFKGNEIINPTIYEQLTSWIKLGGINRIFNLGIILLFLVAAFFKKTQFQMKYKILYFILLSHFIILLFTSPQFRFFLPEFVFLFALLLSSLIQYFRISFVQTKIMLLTSILLPIIITYFLDYSHFTKNKLHQKKEKYHWSQVIIPEKNTQYPNLIFNKIQEGNLEYYSPQENFFFYGNANGSLPSVNKVQVDYLKKKYLLIPQQRTSSIKDGFYSKKVTPNE